MQPLGQFAITVFSFLCRTNDFNTALVELVKDGAFGLHLTWIAERTDDIVYIHKLSWLEGEHTVIIRRGSPDERINMLSHPSPCSQKVI